MGWRFHFRRLKNDISLSKEATMKQEAFIPLTTPAFLLRVWSLEEHTDDIQHEILLVVGITRHRCEEGCSYHYLVHSEDEFNLGPVDMADQESNPRLLIQKVLFLD